MCVHFVCGSRLFDSLRFITKTTNSQPSPKPLTNCNPFYPFPMFGLWFLALPGLYDLLLLSIYANLFSESLAGWTSKSKPDASRFFGKPNQWLCRHMKPKSKSFPQTHPIVNPNWRQHNASKDLNTSNIKPMMTFHNKHWIQITKKKNTY